MNAHFSLKLFVMKSFCLQFAHFLDINYVGDAPLEYSGTGSAEQPNSTLTSNDEPSSTEIGHSKGPLADTSDIKNVKPTSNINHGHGGMNSLMSSTVSQYRLNHE